VLLRGVPPKVIWLVVGNPIEAFISAPTTALLTLRKS
jgi:predicted nuclease of predicted toxin-antitoxin system